MILTLLWSALAFAGANPPTCDGLIPPPADTVSVAWVSPVARKVPLSRRVPVVLATDLSAWLGQHDRRVGRMLQGLGLRKKGTRPKRAWKVTILEVPTDALCRPLGDELGLAGTTVQGVAVCDHNDRGVRGPFGSCGHTVDRVDDRRGLDLYRVHWADASAAGFCVLPAERYVQGR